MPVSFYLEKRLNKYQESPVRIVWYFGGDRYQTTLGFCIPPSSWDADARRVISGEFNHMKTHTSVLNDYLDSVQKAVNWVENRARYYNANLTKTVVGTVLRDVLSSGREYPYGKEPSWDKMIRERGKSHERIFVHFRGGRYRLIGIGKNSADLKEVVIYQALYGDNAIWVRPYEMFFGKVALPDGQVVNRFQEEA